MAVLEPGKDDHAAIMACIGHVCVQWALLEHNLLGILSAIENMRQDEASIVFAGLDMRQRLSKAISLAEYHKIDRKLIKRIRALRSTIDAAKMVDRRNRAVHGVHKASKKPQHMILTMPRLAPNERDKDMSVSDFYNLSMEIREAGIEAWSIYLAYGAWKFGDHRPEDQSGEFVAARPSVWFKIKQYFSARR